MQRQQQSQQTKVDHHPWNDASIYFQACISNHQFNMPASAMTVHLGSSPLQQNVRWFSNVNCNWLQIFLHLKNFISLPSFRCHRYKCPPGKLSLWGSETQSRGENLAALIVFPAV